MKHRLGSGIRSRLVLGFGFVLVLLAVAGTVGWRSMTLLTGAIRESMRGVEQESSFMETNVLRGAFLEDERTRQEFMSIVNRRGQREFGLGDADRCSMQGLGVVDAAQDNKPRERQGASRIGSI